MVQTLLNRQNSLSNHLIWGFQPPLTSRIPVPFHFNSFGHAELFYIHGTLNGMFSTYTKKINDTDLEKF